LLEWLLGLRRWLLRCDLNELQPLHLFRDAASAAVSATAASSGPKPTSALHLLDDCVMHGEWRDEQHNGEHMQCEGEQCAHTSILTRAWKRERRELTAPLERRGRCRRLHRIRTCRSGHVKRGVLQRQGACPGRPQKLYGGRPLKVRPPHA
jgi:hypothetical protein